MKQNCYIIHENVNKLSFKAIGIFLEGCFLFSFVTLLQFSMTNYLERRRSNFLSKDINLKNCLLEIPIPVPVNLKKTSAAEDSKQNIQGKMLYMYMRTPYINNRPNFILFYSNLIICHYSIRHAEKAKDDIRKSIRSNWSKAICSGCVCPLNSPFNVCFISSSLLDYLHDTQITDARRSFNDRSW